MKRISRRDRANQDIREAARYYQDHAGDATALRFADAVDAALLHIATFPGAGSPRYEFEFGLDGLRGWPLRGFPYLAFYVEGPDQIEVWRVLHAERDLTAELGDAGADSES